MKLPGEAWMEFRISEKGVLMTDLVTYRLPGAGPWAPWLTAYSLSNPIEGIFQYRSLLWKTIWPAMNTEKISVFWFRRDLRLEDNTALARALSSGLPCVAPVYLRHTNH